MWAWDCASRPSAKARPCGDRRRAPARCTGTTDTARCRAARERGRRSRRPQGAQFIGGPTVNPVRAVARRQAPPQAGCVEQQGDDAQQLRCPVVGPPNQIPPAIAVPHAGRGRNGGRGGRRCGQVFGPFLTCWDLAHHSSAESAAAQDVVVGVGIPAWEWLRARRNGTLPPRRAVRVCRTYIVEYYAAVVVVAWHLCLQLGRHIVIHIVIQIDFNLVQLPGPH